MTGRGRSGQGSAADARGRIGAALAAAAALVPLALLAVLAAWAAAGDNPVLRDAGLLVRSGGPVAALLADVTGALALGAALLAGWMLRAEDRARALLLVSVGAGIATVARLTALVLSYALATGQSPLSPRFGSDLGVFIATDLGTWLLIGVVTMAAATTVSLAGASIRLARLVAALIALAFFATAMTGHAAGGDTHEVATSTMLIHLIAVGAWAGGLLALHLLPDDSRGDAPVLRAYSHLALIAWAAVGISGVWALIVRMTGPADLLTSPYVQLAAAKTTLLLVLAGFGVQQRRAITALARSRDGRSGAVGSERRSAVALHQRLTLIELGLLGLAISLAAAMSSSPPPAIEVPPPVDAASALSGYPLPAAPGLLSVLTAWRPDPFGIALACGLVLIWWRPSAPARSRDRTLLLVVGTTLLVLLTSGPLAVYGKVLISAHLLQHLGLVLAGVLMGGAATIPERWRAALRLRPALAVLSGALPALLLVTAYAQPVLLRLALDSHAAHLGLQLLALAAGASAALAARSTRAPLLGAVPGPAVLLIGAVVLLVGDAALAPSWFGATGRTWWADALFDQRWGAASAALAALGVGGAAVAIARRRPEGS